MKYYFFHLVNPSPRLVAPLVFSSIVTPARRFHYVGSFADATFSLIRPARGVGLVDALVRKNSPHPGWAVLVFSPSSETLFPLATLFLALAFWGRHRIKAAFLRPVPLDLHPFVRFRWWTLGVWFAWTVWGDDDFLVRVAVLLVGHGYLYLVTHLGDWVRRQYGIDPPPYSANFAFHPFPLVLAAIPMGLPLLVGTSRHSPVESLVLLLQFACLGYGMIYLLGHLVTYLDPPLLALPPPVGLAMVPVPQKTGTVIREHQTKLVFAGSAAVGGGTLYYQQRQLALDEQRFQFDRKKHEDDHNLAVSQHNHAVREEQNAQTLKLIDRYFAQECFAFEVHKLNRPWFGGRPFQPTPLPPEFFRPPPPLPPVHPIPPPSVLPPAGPPGGGGSGNSSWVLSWDDVVTPAGRDRLVFALLLALGRTLWRWWRG